MLSRGLSREFLPFCDGMGLTICFYLLLIIYLEIIILYNIAFFFAIVFYSYFESPETLTVRLVAKNSFLTYESLPPRPLLALGAST